MSQERIPFWTAYRMWRTGAKGLTVEITLGMLLSLAAQGFFIAVVQFFTMQWLKSTWRNVRRRWIRMRGQQ